MTKEPEPGTTFLIIAVASLVRRTQKMRLEVVTRLFVTIIAEAPAAKFTVPDGVLIVLFPVCPAAVIVLLRERPPAKLPEDG